MKLEKQVCSLASAKRLKELGVEQESYFYWSGNEEDKMRVGGVMDTLEITGDPFNGLEQNEYKFVYSAFTVAELGEILPFMVDGKRVEFWKFPYGWTIRYEPMQKNEFQVYFAEGDTEADARAAMLIYLLENKLIEADSLKQ